MNSLKRNAIVPFTCRQMFELVNNIEDYPRFLPWCHSSNVISRTEKEVVATLEINWKGIRKSFSTRNILHPYDKIEINLVNGPLKHMEGIWEFIPLDTHACKINLELEFEFAGGFIDRFFQPVFQHIANTLVDAFTKRAIELYSHE
ncbi:MAG: type II toxin-antitoxin system RatA family toxin [Gammaproteobacteria bacterium]|nr:type II toxin-antitoxin system RatA family toxin [Gammaproteobacteria bacterium]